MDKERNDYYRLLLLNAKAGDNKSLEELFNCLKPMVIRIVRAYSLDDREQADLIQDGMIGLYKAFLNYDITSESSFYSYAYTCAYRQVVSAVRNSLTQKNLPLSSYISLSGQSDIDDEEFDLPSQELTPEEAFENRERNLELVSKIKNVLSGFEFSVLKEYLSGKSYKEIAKQLDKNDKSVDNAMVRIKSKLKFLEK